MTLRYLPALALCLVSSSTVLAHESPDLSAQSLGVFANDSDLVFHGTTEKIQYAESTPATTKSPAIPHTFVTFRISQVFKGGNQPGSLITLRFLGGKMSNDEILQVSDFPLFDIGDQDVLFVAGNGKKHCPLYRCKSGRFRMIGGKVYTENGYEIWRDQEGNIGIGPYRHLEEVTTHSVGTTHLILTGSLASSKRPEISNGQRPVTEKIKADRALSGDDFVQLLSNLTRQSSGEQQPVWSQDPDVPFISTFGIPSSPRTPKKLVPIDRVLQDMSPSDRREYEEFLKNRLNPVIKETSDESDTSLADQIAGFYCGTVQNKMGMRPKYWVKVEKGTDTSVSIEATTGILTADGFAHFGADLEPSTSGSVASITLKVSQLNCPICENEMIENNGTYVHDTGRLSYLIKWEGPSNMEAFSGSKSDTAPVTDGQPCP